jgi:hypothetical protein
VRDAVAVLLADDAHPLVVNVVGPLGVGKSTVLAALAGEDPVVDARRPDVRAELRRVLGESRTVVHVDGVDRPGVAEVLATEVDRADAVPHVVVAGRRPLPLRDGGTGGQVVLAVPRWDGAAIRELARALGVGGDDVDLVERLAGGLPLVAHSLCGALLAPTPAQVPGAVADRALREILARLGQEQQSRHVIDALGTLATVGVGDEELLAELVATPHDQDWFAELSDLSLVTATECGLSLVEPFQTLLDLKHRWRRPVAHRTALTKAMARNRRLLATTTDESRRRALTEHSLFLTDDPLVRQALFPPAPEMPVVRPASASDEDDISALVHEWARQGGLSTARCERLLDGWLTRTADGFHMVCGPDGRPVGMTYTPRITDDSIAVIEPVTQQHTAHLIDAEHGGSFVGMAVCDPRDPAAHAALLRHVLAEGIRQSGLVIATPSRQYQHLAGRLGFHHHGEVRHDPYECGRPAEVYHQRFADQASVSVWLDQFAGTSLAEPVGADLRWCVAQVRSALEHLHDSTRLARSPLVALTATAEGLHSFLTDAIADLAAAGDQSTAQSGHLLHAYYVRRKADHLGIAHQLHLSRATYFRRLDRGLTILARRLLDLTQAQPTA